MILFIMILLEDDEKNKVIVYPEMQQLIVSSKKKKLQASKYLVLINLYFVLDLSIFKSLLYLYGVTSFWKPN